MVYPSEILFWDILPAIRREIVIELKELGIKQNEIAKTMGITPSAVSQYLKNKRGDFEFSKEFSQKIKESAKRIKEDSSIVFNETNMLVKEFENSKAICIVCRKKNNIPENCGVCFKYSTQN